MPRSQEPKPAASQLRKLTPTAELPPINVLKALSRDDVELLKRRLEEVAECVFNERFRRDDAEAVLLGPPPSGNAKGRSSSDDSGIDLLASGSSQPLTTEQEQHYFLRLNFCRYQVMKLLREFRETTLTQHATGELLRWEHLAVRTRSDIVGVNVPLVLAMARRTRIVGADYADLISEGNLALMRSVDKFDCSRGYKFSTYACRAILKAFSRVAARSTRYRGMFPTEFDPTLEKSDFTEQKRAGKESECVDELKWILGSNVAHLSDVEQRVIRARFALDHPVQADGSEKAKTLEQVGEMIGVTKERVRQIQNKALGKLRNALEDNVLAS